MTTPPGARTRIFWLNCHPVSTSNRSIWSLADNGAAARAAAAQAAAARAAAERAAAARAQAERAAAEARAAAQAKAEAAARQAEAARQAAEKAKAKAKADAEAKAAAAKAAAEAANKHPCTSGIMTEGKTYSGSIPYFVPNSIVQLRVTITNVNTLGFIGWIHAYTYSSHDPVTTNLTLLPYHSKTFTGPTYTTPIQNKKGVPFNLELDPISDAVTLAYQVCI